MGLKSGISRVRARAKKVRANAKVRVSLAGDKAKKGVAKAKKAIFNVPNMLSLCRVFLAPLVLIFLTLRIPNGDFIAGTVFIIAALTDSLDGYIARKFKLVTTLGKFIDSLADKVLVIAALVALVELHRLPSWMVMVIIIREFVVTGLRLVAAAEGVVIEASPSGKLKTVSQVIAICLVIFNLPGGMFSMWIAMILTVVSGMQYLMNGKKILLEE